ncbi:MAG: histidine phosphatase family protein [Planctomycetota bacterium]
MSTLYLVRHGRTRLNEQRAFRGAMDVPLDDVGESEGRALGEALAPVALGEILTSPLARARRTAQFIAQRTGTTIRVSKALRDIDYGEWTGRSEDEVRWEFGALYSEWMRTPEKVRFPGGESLGDVRRRVEAPMREIADSGGTIAVVSHRVVLKVMICVGLGLGDDYFRRFHMDTASYSQLDFDGVWRLTVLNESAHLLAIPGHLTAVDF